MSDEEWGTVSVKPKKTAREIDALRQRYLQQREALGQLAADAPSDHLAREYMRVKGEVETALSKLEALEANEPLTPGRPTMMDTPLRTDSTLRGSASSRAGAGLTHSTPGDPADTFLEGNPRVRLVLIPLIGLLVLGALAFFLWRSFGRKDPGDRVVEQTTGTSGTASTIEESPTVMEPVAALSIAPAFHDYGNIRKGTRATRQFELANPGSGDLTIKVARSSCRCLYYEYVDALAPKGKSSLTVTVDGGKAKKGNLQETVEIQDKSSSQLLGSFEVVAKIE